MIVNNRCTDTQLLEFWNLLDMTASAIERAREKELKNYGLSTVQGKVLISLWILDHDPTLGELSNWLFREQSSTSCITEKMASKGLIRKYMDPVKKLMTRIAMTEKGENEFNKIVSRESLLKILSELTREECLHLRDCLKNMISHTKTETDIRHSLTDAQLMVNCILELYGGKDSNAGIIPDIQIKGINQRHLLQDIMYSYCTPDQFIVWVYLDQARYAISRLITMELREYGLSLIQNKVLSTLSVMHHHPTLGDLAMWLFREHNSTSGITDRMARKGLIEKYQDPFKKHLTRVSITENGRQANLDVLKMGNIQRILSFLTPEECEQVKYLLIKLFAKAIVVAGLKNQINLDKLIY